MIYFAAGVCYNGQKWEWEGTAMKIWGGLFSLLAVVLTATAVWICAYCPGMRPALLYVPEEASRTVETVMDSICRGDFAAAEERMYGDPDLGVDRELSDPFSRIFWDAYVRNLDYILLGECYAGENCLIQEVKIISMDLYASTEFLGERARLLLMEGVEKAEDVSRIYDENNEYRESFVSEVMQEAARQALEEDVRYGYQVVPVQLVCEQGQWYVMPTRELIAAISGVTVDQG